VSDSGLFRVSVGLSNIVKYREYDQSLDYSS